MVDAPMRREAFPIALTRYGQRRPASSTSVGELGMTRRISLVAACCSRRSRHNAVARLEFCEQPHVLDCNNVLVGKGLEKVDPTVRQRPFLQPGNARPPRPSDRGRDRSQEIERGGSAGGGTKPGRAGRCLHGVDPKWCAEMLYGASSMFLVHRARIAERAVNSRLPTVCVAPSYVRRGCLMSYSLNFQDLYRPAAYFVDKILKGAGGRPGRWGRITYKVRFAQIWTTNASPPWLSSPCNRKSTSLSQSGRRRPKRRGEPRQPFRGDVRGPGMRSPLN